ncbi:MAG: tRNA 2-thiouridine(34) synthase MnmA [Gammaproteobacteria bacterium]|nr:tRNA 2-thiouridine(34) synthase MnmA [Gammaproteobacteria bacterium]
MTKVHQQFVVVGLSGGVDSAVAALLMQNQGYRVEALFMQNWQEESGANCSASQDLKDAQHVCDVLKIKLHIVNFSVKYWNNVFQYFLDEYAAGRTPNPDVLCNKEIKFRAFLDHAKSLGADFIATGHYARRITIGGRELLLKGLDKNKDQSYFLYLLNQEQLASSLFPLGELTKQQVREIAENAAFPNYAKKDSTGICFIGERKFKEFLSEYLLARPGDIITADGQVLGRHDGLMFYTLGQRKGIGVGGQKSSQEAPWYVAIKDLKNNALIITQNKEDPSLMAQKLTCNQLHWISNQEPEFPFECHAKIRYRQQDQRCVITQPNDSKEARVDFFAPQWAITPGQSIVFYRQEECLGGGIITQ